MEDQLDADFLSCTEETALSMVQEHLNKQMPEKAIETLESYLFISPHETYEKRAQSRIKELKKEHNL